MLGTHKKIYRRYIFLVPCLHITITQIFKKVFDAWKKLPSLRCGIIANATAPNSQPSLVPPLCSNKVLPNLVPWISPAYQALALWQGVLHNQRLQSRLRSSLPVPIISYYVKSLPLTHATPAACLCPPCHRFYFYNFVESSCIKCVLRTAYTMYFSNVRLFLFYLQSYPTARFARVAYKKKYPCQLLKKYIVPVRTPFGRV